jgi:hypothetical protein
LLQNRQEIRDPKVLGSSGALKIFEISLKNRARSIWISLNIEEKAQESTDRLIIICSIEIAINGNFRILKWRYCTI